MTYNGTPVFNLETGISLSSNPAITFGFVPKAAGQLKVVARDSDHTEFTHVSMSPVRAVECGAVARVSCCWP